MWSVFYGEHANIYKGPPPGFSAPSVTPLHAHTRCVKSYVPPGGSLWWLWSSKEHRLQCFDGVFL